jgi:hypothetical protein
MGYGAATWSHMISSSRSLTAILRTRVLPDTAALGAVFSYANVQFFEIPKDIVVAKSSDRFALPTSGGLERGFDGSALSEVRDPLRSADIQTDIIFGDCYKCLVHPEIITNICDSCVMNAAGQVCA